MLGQWAAPLLFEARQFLSLFGPSCNNTPWGAIGLAIVLAFLVGYCCGIIAACIVLSGQCRRLLLWLLRELAFETLGIQGPRLSAEQRLAEYRHRA